MISHKIIKYVPPWGVAHNVLSWNNIRQNPITKEELQAHLLNHPYAVGDWLIYRASTQNGQPATPERCAIVVTIEMDPTKVLSYNNTPKPFLLMQLSGTSEPCRVPGYKYSTDPWCRWDDSVGMRLVTAEEKERMADDYVQDYIKKFQPQAHKFVR